MTRLDFDRPTVDSQSMREAPGVLARAFGDVLRSPRYCGVALLGATLGLLFIVVAQNVQVVFDVVILGGLSLFDRFGVLWGLLPGNSHTYTPGTTAFVVSVAVLIGLNFAFMAYRFGDQGDMGLREGSGSTLGAVFAVFGVGCTACGLPIVGELALIFGFAGAVGTVGFLPFGGLEFTAIAVVALVGSLYWNAKHIDGAVSCDADCGC